MTGTQPRRPRTHGSAIGMRWVYYILLAAIAILAVGGIVSAVSMGQTQVAVVIGVVALAFFSRIGC